MKSYVILVVVLGVVLGKMREKILYPIYYASKAINADLKNYTVIEQELLGIAVILHKDNLTLRYLMAKKYVKP